MFSRKNGTGKQSDSSEIATSGSSSRFLIHASSGDDETGLHPQWRAQDKEVTSCPFTLEVDGIQDMSEINSRLVRVLDKAPSDSSANLILKKTKDGYRAFFRVRSAQNRFAGFITGRRLVDVVERVMRDVKTQIDDWKSKRQLLDEPS